MRLNIGLLKAVAVLFTLDILVFHIFALKALLLPIELKVNITSNSGNRQIWPSQFHYFSLDVIVRDSCQFWVHLKVLGYDFVSQLSKSLNLI